MNRSGATTPLLFYSPQKGGDIMPTFSYDKLRKIDIKIMHATGCTLIPVIDAKLILNMNGNYYAIY